MTRRFGPRSSGCWPRSACSAKRFRFLIRYEHGVTGCLVLDVRMPGASGLDLQRILNQAETDLPVIFVTAHADVPLTVRAMKAGALEVLTKPFDD